MKGTASSFTPLVIELREQSFLHLPTSASNRETSPSDTKTQHDNKNRLSFTETREQLLDAECETNLVAMTPGASEAKPGLHALSEH